MQSTNTKCDETIIHSAYSLKPKHKLRFTTKGRTKQSFKAECDINQIMARFLRTGVLDFTQKNEPRYGDCTGWEYQSAMLKVAGAKSMFEGLPAELRSRFDNDPAKFLYFVQDSRNREEAQALGLLKPVATPKADEATPLPATPAATSPKAATRSAKGEGARGKASDASDAPDKTNPST